MTCPISKLIWHRLRKWLSDKCNIHISFSDKEILPGICIQENELLTIINKVFFITKQYLYAARCKEEQPNFHELLKRIEYQYKIEETAALQYGNENKHKSLWSHIRFVI